MRSAWLVKRCVEHACSGSGTARALGPAQGVAAPWGDFLTGGDHTMNMAKGPGQGPSVWGGPVAHGCRSHKVEAWQGLPGDAQG